MPQAYSRDFWLHRQRGKVLHQAAGHLWLAKNRRCVKTVQRENSFGTGAIWKEPALKSFHTFASLGIPSYMYCFARTSPANQTSGELASHCCDLPYLFGHVTTGEKYNDTDVQISKAIRYAVTAFTYTSVPRFANDEPWSKVDPNHPKITLLAETIRE
ncbi:hypothetical protein NQZ79_g3810 [Umbelopsis isabellina]|nr:hypothetical protein NQZ79_g3810 [Umbelopsis isabellina]